MANPIDERSCRGKRLFSRQDVRSVQLKISCSCTSAAPTEETRLLRPKAISVTGLLLCIAGMSLPPQHVDESWQSAEFYANKLLMEHRNTDAGATQVAWVRTLKEVFQRLKAYVRKHHLAGPAWNPNGIPVSEFQQSRSEKAAGGETDACAHASLLWASGQSRPFG